MNNRQLNRKLIEQLKDIRDKCIKLRKQCENNNDYSELNKIISKIDTAISIIDNWVIPQVLKDSNGSLIIPLPTESSAYGREGKFKLLGEKFKLYPSILIFFK